MGVEKKEKRGEGRGGQREKGGRGDRVRARESVGKEGKKAGAA